MILHLLLQTMVMVPAGTFTMGSSPEQQAWAVSHGATAPSVADEGPQHTVTLPAFALGRSLVTRDEYAAFVHDTHRVTPRGCGRDSYKWDLDSALSWEHPGFRQTGHDPVVCVSWNDAQAYVAWLNAKAGGTSYRLPSEAEWEYAARSASALGLHDMLGKVWQWTADCYAENYVAKPRASCMRVDRGATASYPKWMWRATTRERNPADFRDRIMGFRIARTL